MKQATLSDFIALNDQLLALIQAGVPVSLALGAKGQSAPEALERINAAVARSVGQGASIAQALEENDALTTPAYRCLMQVGLQRGDLSSALCGAHDVAETVDDAEHALWLSLLYPAILCVLAYLGLIGFLLFLVPSLRHIVVDLRLTMGSVISVLSALRESLYYWVALPPLVLIVVLLAIRRRRQDVARRSVAAQLSRWLPGAARAIFEQQCASFAGTLANALEADMPLDEAVRVTAGVWNESTLAAQLREAAPALVATPGATIDRLPSSLPAFLRWAMVGESEPEQRVHNLRMVAGVYRKSAARRMARMRVIVPLITCVVIGGGVTLLYGLTLFLPVVQLLRDLAQPS